MLVLLILCINIATILLLIYAKMTICCHRIHLTAHHGQVRPDGIRQRSMVDEGSAQSTAVQEQDVMMDTKVQALLQARIYQQVYQSCAWKVFRN